MKDKSCNVTGCSNVHEAKGWCKMHYMRFQRHGDILFTRDSDWGARERHPLYKVWNGLVRTYSARGLLEREWAEDLWKFVSDVKEKPGAEYRLSRKDKTKPFGPDNWHWRKVKYFKTTDAKEYAKLWQRKKRAEDPEFSFSQSIKKCFGITIDQYHEIYKSQHGVCAICHKPEKAVHHKTKKIRRLAIDHCHTTGKIRGLLCTECNRGLGSFKDSIDSLKKAINYLGG